MAKDVHNKSVLDPYSQRIMDQVVENTWAVPEPELFGINLFTLIKIVVGVIGVYVLYLSFGAAGLIVWGFVFFLFLVFVNVIEMSMDQ